jgi:antirestriction protein ArdC
MLCEHAGLLNKTIDNSVAYLQSWIKVLKNDMTLIVHAASKAQKAVDYILGYQEKEGRE